MVARGTSQACSYRSQESYFQNFQVVKEALRKYEDAQGLQYREKPVHLDRALVRPILATFAHYQRELSTVKEDRQTPWDRQVDAQVRCREAENQVTQLKSKLSKSQGAVP